MSEPIVYVDCSEVREGKLQELKAAVKGLADFVEAHEPQIIAYNVYFTEDGAQMSIVHMHRDSDSLAFHMRVAGPEFPKFGAFLKLLSIDLYGQPSSELVETMRQKARMLGTGTVVVHPHHAGFARFAP